MSDLVHEFKCSKCVNPCIVRVHDSDGMPSKCVYGLTSVACRWDAVISEEEISYIKVEQWEDKDTMFTVNGEHYRCDCCCNVFRNNIKHTKAKCNSCNAVYSTER